MTLLVDRAERYTASSGLDWAPPGSHGIFWALLGLLVLSGARLESLGLLGSHGLSSGSAGLFWKLRCSSVLFSARVGSPGSIGLV